MADKELTNVPTANVGEVAQAFADEGFANVTCTKIAENNWTVRASS